MQGETHLNSFVGMGSREQVEDFRCFITSSRSLIVTGLKLHMFAWTFLQLKEPEGSEVAKCDCEMLDLILEIFSLK